MANWVRTTAAVVALGLVSGSATAMASGNVVRGESALSTSVVDDGLGRSATIRELVSELEGSGVLVYVNVGLDATANAGFTRLGAGTGTMRVLRVFVSGRLTPGRRLEILGHELMHCVEIARAAAVRDDGELIALERGIGWRAGAGEAYETKAAVLVERRVHSELGR